MMRLLGSCLLLLSLLALRADADSITINLGTAGSFALLAGSGVTNANPGTFINGDVGSSPTPAVVGLTPVMVNGNLYLTPNATTAQAQTDLTLAYNAAAGVPGGTNLTGQDLGGLSLAPGVYFFSSSAGLNGTLTLDGLGDPNAQFIFQVGNSLTTAPNSTVSLINGASPNNVYFQVGSTANIGMNNTFTGIILANTSITLEGGTLNGQALVGNGAITISGQQIVNNLDPVRPVPEPATILLLGTGRAAVRRRRKERNSEDE